MESKDSFPIPRLYKLNKNKKKLSALCTIVITGSVMFVNVTSVFVIYMFARRLVFVISVIKSDGGAAFVRVLNFLDNWSYLCSLRSHPWRSCSLFTYLCHVCAVFVRFFFFLISVPMLKSASTMSTSVTVWMAYYSCPCVISMAIKNYFTDWNGLKLWQPFCYQSVGYGRKKRETKE